MPATVTQRRRGSSVGVTGVWIAGPARVSPLTPCLGPEPCLQLTVSLPAGPPRQLDWVDELHELCRQLPGAAVEARSVPGPDLVRPAAGGLLCDCEAGRC